MNIPLKIFLGADSTTTFFPTNAFNSSSYLAIATTLVILLKKKEKIKG